MASGTPHKAKPSKRHNIMRSVRNKAKGVYVRQRIRTEARKARRRRGDTAKQRRIARRREARLARVDDETRDLREARRDGGPPIRSPQPPVRTG